MSDKFISASEIRELLGIAPDGDCKKCRFLRGMFGCQQSRDFVRVCEAIDDCSAADVRTVVHGEWEEIAIIPDAYDIAGVITWASKMRCQKCGFTTYAIEGGFSQYNFCPNCGADMRPERGTKE